MSEPSVNQFSPRQAIFNVSGSRWMGPATACLVGVLFIGWFHRDFFLSNFNAFEGDWGDGRFVALVASHWADPNQFPGGWLDLGIFAPYEKALAYSDTFLLHGIVGAPLQWLGVGFLPSFQWSLVTLGAASYAATVTFMRIGPRGNWLVSISTGVLVTFSNGLALSSAHPQLQAVSLGGIVLLFSLLSLRARSPLVAALWGFAVGSSMVLIVTSTFYAGWMLFLGLSATGIMTMTMLIARRIPLRWSRIAVSCGGTVVGATAFVPVFLSIYGQAIIEGASRSLDVALGTSLRISELTMMSQSNLAWGQVVGELFTETRPYEYWFAPTIGLVLGVIVLALRAMWRWRDATAWTTVGLAFGFVGVVAWLVPVNFFGWSPWQIVYGIPGAQAIRAIGRFELLAGFLLAIAIGMLAVHAIKSASRVGRMAVSVLLLIVMVEQVNTIERQSYSQLLSSSQQQVPDPPASCHFFVLLDPRWETPGWAEQIDAMAIARSTGLPTLNGYSAWSPPGWLLDIDAPDYLGNARSWTGRWFLQGVCGYLSRENRWVEPDATREFLAEAART